MRRGNTDNAQKKLPGTASCIRSKKLLTPTQNNWGLAHALGAPLPLKYASRSLHATVLRLLPNILTWSNAGLQEH